MEIAVEKREYLVIIAGLIDEIGIVEISNESPYNL